MRVGLVSIFPLPNSKHSKQSGVALYSKNLVDSMKKYCSVEVYSEKLCSSMQNEPETNGVHRCWNKGILYPFQIFKKLLSSHIDVVHLQHETYLYGGLFSAIVFPFLLFLVKLLKKPEIVTLHGVIPLSRVDNCFLEENWINGNPLIMRVGLTLLVKVICALSTAIIVHEKILKSILVNEYYCDSSKIHVIYHGIEESKLSLPSKEAKHQLGVASKNVILFFGYITGYKNVDLLIEAAKFLSTPDWVILIAGGTHPRLSTDSTYLTYLSNLHKKASKISKEKIMFNGFIPENEVPKYFSAADLVIFPHNICISSSGPLSIAAAYNRSFLVTTSFKDIVDFNKIVFKKNPRELAQKIDLFFMDSKFRLDISEFTQKFKSIRSWDAIAQQTIEIYAKLLMPHFTCNFSNETLSNCLKADTQ